MKGQCSDNLTFRLRRKIEILQLVDGQNEYGESQRVWQAFKSPFASAEPLLGREFFAAEAAQSKVEIKFRLRYTPGIETTMRIRHRGSDYEILSVVNVEDRDREMLLYARKVQ